MRETGRGCKREERNERRKRNNERQDEGKGAAVRERYI